MTRALLLMVLLTGCSASGQAGLDGAALDRTDPRRITVTGIHGTCDELRAPVVEQDAERVRVSVPLRRDRGDCNDAGVLFERAVDLDAPLGARRVVDRDGRQLPVEGRDRCRPSPDSDPALLGLSVDQARARHGDRPFRTTCVDGRVLVGTADRRPDRLNVSVDDGIVTATSLG